MYKNILCYKSCNISFNIILNDHRPLKHLKCYKSAAVRHKKFLPFN